MLYTVGIKRLFWGFKKYQVTGHKWDNWRLILDLPDGSQLHIPGVKISALKVYPDVRQAIEQAQRFAREREMDRYYAEKHRQGAYVAPPEPEPVAVDELSPYVDTNVDDIRTQARKLANERVRAVLPQ
jgi:regulator of protease activity HflC (stomatin/prohibitin superfamily)